MLARPRGAAERDTGTLRTGRLAHRFTGARTNTTRGCAGRGGLQRWPDALGGLGHASRPSELAPIGAGCSQADCHSHADSTPCRVCPCPYGRLLAPNSASFPYVDFYIGERLAMGGTGSGQGAPLVSTKPISGSDSIFVPGTATGTRERARPSRAVLRLYG